MAKARSGAMVVDLKVGESLSLELTEDQQCLLRPGLDIREIRLTLRAKNGQRARFVVQVDESVKVNRPEKVPA